jgi:hypothetical protein
MSGFNEHKVMLFLNPDLYTAFVKLQADRGLGRSYAGLLPFVEGLYRMGYLSQDVYEAQVKRYSEPLIQKKPTQQDIFEKQDVMKADKTIKSIIEQFANHKQNPAWLQSVRKYAERFSQLDSAKTLLGMVEKATSDTVATVREDPVSLTDSEKAAQLRQDLRGQTDSYREGE